MMNGVRRSHWRRVLAGMVVIAAALVVPAATAWSTDIDVQLVVNSPMDDAISELNPPSARFDVVYQAGDIKSDDGLTTLGTFMWTITRSDKANADAVDGVIVLPGGNIYIKLVRNHGDGSVRGIIVGGDGPFAGVSGGIALIGENTYRFTLP